MRILVTGAAGTLGRAVCRQLAGSHDVVASTRADLELTDDVAVQARVVAERPDWIVHLAALTDVDRCEREPDLAFAVNAGATESLAAACAQTGAGLLLLSSIAVFDGRKPAPYVETDAPAPINVYGASKWAAERVAAGLSRYLIARSGWLFGGWPDDRKFVGHVLRLGRERAALRVVDDKVGSPTYAPDLAAGLERLLAAGRRGLVHLVNDGPPVSRYDLAREILAIAGLPAELERVASAAFPGLAPRPAMEAADSRITRGWLRPWPEALGAYLAAVGPVS